MKKIINKITFFIILISLFIFNNIVYAKTYTSYKIGDIVKFSKGSDVTSEWIVIKDSNSDEDSLKLLKSTIVDGKESIPYGSATPYENSLIKTTLDTYGETLSLGQDLKSIGLISVEELNGLGCVNSTCKNSYSWLIVPNSSYWTSTIFSNWGVNRVRKDGNIVPDGGYTNDVGMRPVVVVSKESILKGYVNDEIDFGDIKIDCPDKVKGGEEFTCYINISKEVKKINFDLSINGSAKIEHSIKLQNWNENLPTVSTNGDDYLYKNISLTKKENNENTELLSLTIKPEINKEEKYKAITLSNLKLIDKVGDYQTIDKLEKKIIVENINEINNPKTGIYNNTGILCIVIGLSILTFLVVKKYSKA